MAHNSPSFSVLSNVADEFKQHRQRSKLFLLTAETANDSKPLSNFYRRLKTFQPSNWVTKPNGLSPWLCSRYGWICVEKNLLQCIDCQSYLSSHLPSFTDVNLYQKCCDRFRASLIESHSKTCVWRSNPVPLTDCTPETSDRQAALNDFVERYNQIKSSCCSLNNLVLENHPNSLMITNEDLDTLAQLVNDSSKDFSKNAALMSLFGWKCAENVPDALFCDQCLRTLGLWLFRGSTKTSSVISKQNDNSVDDDSNSSSPSRKRFCTEKDRLLCPEGQHYSWCPWVNPMEAFSVLYISSTSTKNEISGVPRWRALLCLLNRPAEVRRNSIDNIPLSEHFVMAKQLLDETLSKVEGIVECETTLRDNVE